MSHFYTRALPGENEAQFCERLIDEIRQLISTTETENIAAFFCPNRFTPPVALLSRLPVIIKSLKALLVRHDILLVADEVVCGYGRLGSWFGSPQLGLEPDMMATAKV